MKTQTFEQYLMEKHCEENPTILDDMLPDDFPDWISERLDIDSLISYGDEYHKEKIDKIRKIVIEDVPHQYQNRLLELLNK